MPEQNNTKCPQCAGNIDIQQKYCPQCGYYIADLVEQVELEQYVKQYAEIKQKAREYVPLMIKIILKNPMFHEHRKWGDYSVNNYGDELWYKERPLISFNCGGDKASEENLSLIFHLFPSFESTIRSETIKYIKEKIG